MRYIIIYVHVHVRTSIHLHMYLVEASMHLIAEKDVEFREKVLELSLVLCVGLVQVLLSDYPHHCLLDGENKLNRSTYTVCMHTSLQCNVYTFVHVV